MSFIAGVAATVAAALVLAVVAAVGRYVVGIYRTWSPGYTRRHQLLQTAKLRRRRPPLEQLGVTLAEARRGWEGFGQGRHTPPVA